MLCKRRERTSQLVQLFLIQARRVCGADTRSGTIGTCPDDHSTSLLDQATSEANGTDKELVSKSIIEILRTCFEFLWDPAQSRETRRLLLQNYQTATQILRTALLLDGKESSLAEPISVLALYEVCCLVSEHVVHLTDRGTDDRSFRLGGCHLANPSRRLLEYTE
jgi:hypothetical protein